jgi:hypothetical protein
MSVWDVEDSGVKQKGVFEFQGRALSLEGIVFYKEAVLEVYWKSVFMWTEG